MAQAAAGMTANGAGVVLPADMVGRQPPFEAAAMFAVAGAGAGPGVVLGSHLHDDLGLGLANTLEALGAGVRVASAPWLGIAERSGMVATEQLLFLLAHDPVRAARLLGKADADGPRSVSGDDGLWWTVPDLTRLPGIAAMVAEQTGVPLTVTTPGGGHRGRIDLHRHPFVNPGLFQPFDPRSLLGGEPQVVLTHLASARVVTAVAAGLGHRLDAGQARAAMGWVKTRAYRTGRDHPAYDRSVHDHPAPQRGPPVSRTPDSGESAEPGEHRPAAPGDTGPDRGPSDGGTSDGDTSDEATVRLALARGSAVVLPNPAPLTCVVAATEPAAVNTAKQRPPGQAVALWAHHPATLDRLAGLLALDPAGLRLARRLLTEELLTLLVPVRDDAAAPGWLDPATRDGWALLFGARRPALRPLLDQFPLLYVSSANRSGQPPCPTPAEAAAVFAPAVPVLAEPAPAGSRGPATDHEPAQRRATTTVRLHPDGRLDLHRHGAQDLGRPGGPADYLAHLRRTYGT